MARYKGKVSRIYFRADAGFANPEVYQYLEAERIKYAIRLPANRVLQERIGYLLKRPVGRPTLDVRRSHANLYGELVCQAVFQPEAISLTCSWPSWCCCCPVVSALRCPQAEHAMIKGVIHVGRYRGGACRARAITLAYLYAVGR